MIYIVSSFIYHCLVIDLISIWNFCKVISDQLTSISRVRGYVSFVPLVYDNVLFLNMGLLYNCSYNSWVFCDIEITNIEIYWARISIPLSIKEQTRVVYWRLIQFIVCVYYRLQKSMINSILYTLVDTH